jgi:hypothetical protein
MGGISLQTLQTKERFMKFDFDVSRFLKMTLLSLLAVFFIANFTLLAQEQFSALTGTATDRTGAVVPGVVVTITNKATERVQTATTGADGIYIARRLEPGRYSVKFQAVGFSILMVPDVNLLLGQNLKVDASLEVSGTEQSIVVMAEESPLIDISTTVIAHNVTSEEFDQLPKGRSFQSLVAASPSVNTGEIEGGYQVNGSSGSENQFTIDGVSTNSGIDGRSRQNASFEFLQEVQVKSGGVEAEYGGALGGVISAITKSGGNAFHGEVHYYFSGNSISAGPVQRLLLDPTTEKAVSNPQDDKFPDNRHEIGGSLGGYLVKDIIWFYTSITPTFRRESRDYLFSSGTEPDTLERKTTSHQAFNKLSLRPTDRLSANFTFLWSPTTSTGRLPAYNFANNSVVSSKDGNQVQKTMGYFAPQSSYTGNIEYMINNTTALSVRAGRFWDNFKDTGISSTTSVTYQTSATSLPFDIPAALRQPINYYNTPRTLITFHDLVTRSFVQADFTKFFKAMGTHDLKAGWGLSKSVNNVDQSYPGGYTYIYWDSSFKSSVTGLTQRGVYGYYAVTDYGTKGTAGGPLQNLYIQDKWTIHPRLTLSLGLRTEKESMPSFQRNIQDPAFSFTWKQKLAPRIGASYDVYGNGKLKLYGFWGIFYDWVKYELARGTFGAQVYNVYYYALDTTDIFNLNLRNLPGKNLWSDVSGSYRNRRVPGFNNVDPDIKPMSTQMVNFGAEYQLNPQMVFSGRYVHNSLRRTIEDLGALVNGDEVYVYGNPGEGLAKMNPVSGLTKPFPMPKAKRKYDALELSLTRRFAAGWFGSASYVYSRLWGNYAGLGASDEITTPTTGVSSGTTQQAGGSIARPGSNVTRGWDIDELSWDSHGKLDNTGLLATDRPHVIKLYGDKGFKEGNNNETKVGLMFYAGSGTPLSTYVVTLNQTEVFVEGRGDLGRTPFFTQTDLMLAHEVKVGEGRTVRFEFNALNFFNQKTARHTFNWLNKGAGAPRASSSIDLSGTDLAKGYNYRAMIAASADGQNAFDPRFGKEDLWNPGFQGRFSIKFTF